MAENESEKPKVENLNKEGIDVDEEEFAIPGGRGNYTADKVFYELEKKEKMKDEASRDMGRSKGSSPKKE